MTRLFLISLLALTTFSLHAQLALPAASLKKIESGVVRIFNIRYDEQTGRAGLGTGSGFILNSNGDIATNLHVVNGTKRLLVTSRQGNDVHVRLASVLKTDEERDLAVIHANPLPSTIPTTLCTARPQDSMPVWSVGFPGLVDDDAKFEEFLFKELFAQENVGSFRDLVIFLLKAQASQVDRTLSNKPSAVDVCTPSIGSGIVARMTRRAWHDGGTELDVIVHSAKTVHGNSGGPLVNSDGNVIGINTQIRGVGGTTQGGEQTMNNEYGMSSFITELAGFARSVPVQLSTTDKLPLLDGGGSSLSLAMKAALVLVALLAVAGILIALQKKGGAETFTQYLRRGGDVSRLRRAILGGVSQGGAAPPPAPRPGRSPQTVVPVHIPGVGSNHAVASASYALSGRTSDGRRIQLSFTDDDLNRHDGKLVIGRKAELVHLHIDDESLSRQHASIVRRGSSLYLEDRGSANGTSVDGEKIGAQIEAIKLKPGSRVKLGTVNLSFIEQG